MEGKSSKTRRLVPAECHSLPNDMSSRSRPASEHSAIRTFAASLRGDSSSIMAQNAVAEDSSAKYIRDLEEKIGKMESAMQVLEQGLTVIKLGIPTLKQSFPDNRGLQSFNKEIEDYKKQSTEQMAAKQLVDEQLGAAETERKKLERVYHKLQDEAEELRRQLKIRDTELQQTKVRLSEIMGNKLVNNNPDIADLSDPNRPTKLAEKFAELYDNDWTDAFEEILTLGHHDEVKCVQLLLQILLQSESFCTRKWREYVEGCKHSLQKGKAMEVPDIVAKQLKDITKSFAPNLVDDVHKEFKEQSRYSNEAWLFLLEKLQPYLKGCIELCWLMVAQDPPVVFKTGLRSGEEIDKAVLREYTRSGDILEYLVWPPLLLHEGGPLLAKGVAQAVEDAAQSAPSGGRKDTSTRSGARFQVDRPRTAWGETNDDPIVSTPPAQSPRPMSVDVSATHHAAQGNYQQSSVSYYDKLFPSDGHQQQPTGNQLQTHGTSHGGQRMGIVGGQTYIYQQTDSSGRPIQQSQQPLPRPPGWYYSTTPTQREMERYEYYVYKINYPERSIRKTMGNECFDMCRDYYTYQKRLLLGNG